MSVQRRRSSKTFDLCGRFAASVIPAEEQSPPIAINVNMSEEAIFIAATEVRGFMMQAAQWEEVWVDMLVAAYPEWRGESLERMLLSFVVRNIQLRCPCNNAGRVWQVLEFWAGSGNLTMEHVRLGFSCARFDLAYAPSHDCTSGSGLRLWLEALCRVQPGGLVWCGTQCSSFLFLCMAQSQRRPANGWWGDESRAFVRSGNAQMLVCSLLVFVADLLGASVVLEQPQMSVLWRLEPLRSVLRWVGAEFTCTWLGQFGAETPKPLRLWHTDIEYRDLRRPRPGGQLRRRLVALTTRKGKRFTGRRTGLKQSQVYPPPFAEAVAQVTARRMSPALAATQGQHDDRSAAAATQALT